MKSIPLSFVDFILVTADTHISEKNWDSLPMILEDMEVFATFKSTSFPSVLVCVAYLSVMYSQASLQAILKPEIMEVG